MLKGRICLSTTINEDDDVGQLLDCICMKRPDLVEFRTDSLQQFSILKDIAQKKTFPAIIADKAKRGIKDRNALLEEVSAGFEFVDIDLSSDITAEELRKVSANGTELITSYHDTATTPTINELDGILSRAMKRGGNVYKIVTTAKAPKDNLTILNFLEENSPKARLLSFAMGQVGIPSRILSPMFGAEFTFAARQAVIDGSRTALHRRS